MLDLFCCCGSRPKANVIPCVQSIPFTARATKHSELQAAWSGRESSARLCTGTAESTEEVASCCHEYNPRLRSKADPFSETFIPWPLS